MNPRGISRRGNSGMLAASFHSTMDEQVSAGDEEDCDDTGDCEATQNCPGKWGVLFAPRFQRESHGDEPEHRSERCHQDWPQAYLTGGNDRLFELESVLAQLSRELDDEDAVRYDDAGHHQNAYEAHDVDGGAGHQEEEDYAGDTGRDGQQNNKRINEGGELRHQNEEDQHDGKDEACREGFKGLVHVVD